LLSNLNERIIRIRGTGVNEEREEVPMYLETVQTVRRKVWQWLKDQIAQEVPELDGLCDMIVVSGSALKKSGRPASGESTKQQANCGLSLTPQVAAKRPRTELRRHPHNPQTPNGLTTCRDLPPQTMPQSMQTRLMLHSTMKSSAVLTNSTSVRATIAMATI
jgi:hypothetical protein